MTKHKKKQSGSKLGLVAGVAVLAAAVLIALSLRSAPQDAGGKVVSDAAMGATRNVQGQANAKVVLVEYGDYL